MNSSGEQSTVQGSELGITDYDFIIACGYVFIQTGICVLGFILNLINFSVFVQPTFTAPTYIMMMFLSLADAATLGFRIPQGYIFFPTVSKSFTDAVIYVYVYSTYVEVPFTNMSETISAWLTVALAIERYVTMRHWTIAKHYFTPRNTRRLVLIIAVVAIVFNTPYFATQVITLSRVNKTLELKSNLTNFYQSNYYAIYSWLRIVLVQIIPLCFLCVSNCLLFALVSQHNQKFSRQQVSNSKLKTPKASHGFRPGTVAESYVTMSTYEPSVHKATRIALSSNTTTVSDVNRTTSSTKNDKSAQNSSGSTSTDTVPNVTGDRLRTQVREVEEIASLSIPVGPSQRESVQIPVVNHSTCEPTQRQGQFDRVQRRRTAQKKLTILLIAVILLFLIGQVPQSLAYIRVFAALRICSTGVLERCIAHQFYRMITVNLSHLAFAMTFFVYLFLNRDFRHTLVTCACHHRICSWCGCKPISR